MTTMDSVAPGLLIAMPQLVDSTFYRSVVLLVEHDNDSSFGLVLNHPSPHRLDEILRQMEIPWKGNEADTAWNGGPVDRDHGWLLHEPIEELEQDPGTIHVTEGVRLSSANNALKILASSPPENFRFVIGYSGWGEGQLQDELTQGAWIHSHVDDRFLFQCDPETMWESALHRLGVQPEALIPAAGIH